jgi:hypothetical protein
MATTADVLRLSRKLLHLTEALAEIQVVRGAASLQYGTQFEVCKFLNWNPQLTNPWICKSIYSRILWFIYKFYFNKRYK